MKSSAISFKPLQEDDLELLCKWLDKPHVKEWWNDGLSHDEIIEHSIFTYYFIEQMQSMH